MNKFGIPDSVINSVNAVLEAGTKMPRQLKDPKKETMMGFEYKPGKVRNQVVDKKDVKDKEKKGYIHTEEVDEDDIAEAMEVHLKPHGTAGTHYTVHKVGKKLAKHGGIKVGEKLSDTQVDDARDSGVKVRHVKEDAELEESGMGRVAYQKQSGEPGSGLQTFKKRDEKKHGGVVSKKLDPVDSKALMGRLAQRKDKDIDNDGDVDNSDSYLHNRRKTVKTAIKADRTPNYKTKVKKAMKEGSDTKEYTSPGLRKKHAQDVQQADATAMMVSAKQGKRPEKKGRYGGNMSTEGVIDEGVGDEKVRSSAQAAQLAKHYYAKAKAAQASGSKEEAAKMMSAAKTFYRKSESDQAQEKGGKQVAKAESTENVGIGEYYFNELEIEEIEAAEDIVTEEKRKNSGAKVGETERSGHRVTKTEKEGPEHIVMQARKVVSLGKNHAGVEFGDGSKAKVDPKHASAALNRYNQAKPAEKEHMQSTMNHSHDGLKHVASGKAMDHPDNPHKPKANKLSGSDRRTDRAVSLMRHPDDED